MPSKPKNSFLEFILRDAMRDIEGVTARAMFGGHALYKDDIVFGILADEQLYFKADAKSITAYKARDSEPFTYEAKNKKRIAMSYWEVPAEILENPSDLAEWVGEAVAVNRRAVKSKSSKLRKHRG